MTANPPLKLYLGNKNYSSWSFRPWLAMRHAGISFNEQVVPFDEANHNRHFREFSPTGQVPVLEHGELVLCESLAIMEYAAELYPEAGLWPQEPMQRAKARMISHEMHAGFAALRRECPMNMRRKVARIKVSQAAQDDIGRIGVIWDEALAASGGPYLFGAFSNADAMYAPVVNRLHVYDLVPEKSLRGYIDRVMALPAYREWYDAACKEPWIVEEEEV